MVPVSLPDHELPPLPGFLDGPPFGAGRDGKPIRQIAGAVSIASIRQMQDYVSLKTGEELPAAMDAQERQEKIAKAKGAALDLLVERLNAVIPDQRLFRFPGVLAEREQLLLPRVQPFLE